ncbi:unnamed protein product [Paramecium pentaurelia]|uniref:Tetratricopeptide repeat protein n=1 Tax=Paramecium pentaurelia TaxID=43138 RepID=A0A8S1UTD8_9CILI|nr:unnamed protein product [Paramecium pentaurelia]
MHQQFMSAIDATVFFQQTVLFNQEGENEKALLQDYNMAIQLNPNYADLYTEVNHLVIQLGVLFGQKGEMKKHSKTTKRLSYQHQIIHFILQTQKSLFQIKIFCLSKYLFYKSKAIIKFDQTTIDIEMKFIQFKSCIYQQRAQSTQRNQKLDLNNRYLNQLLSKQLQRQKSIQLEEQAYKLVNELTLQIKPLDIQLNINQQTICFQILEPFEQRFNNFLNQITTLAIYVNSLLEQDNCKVSESLKQINKKENKNQLMYNYALAWRLYNYLSAMQQISTNLFQINKNAIIKSKSEQT